MLTGTGVVALIIILGEWTGLARGLLGTPVYAAVLDIALVAVTFAASLRAWLSGRMPRWHLMDLLMLAYFGLAAIEILNPNVPTPLVGLEGFRKTAFTMLAYAAIRFSAGPDRDLLIRWVAVGSVPAFLWAIRQFLGPLDVERQIIESAGTSEISFHAGAVLRAFAPMAGPFHLGIMAGAVIIFALVLTRARSSRWVLPGVVAAVALGLSLTRANIIATVIASGVVVVSSLPGIERVRRLAIAIPLVTVTLAVSFAATLPVGTGGQGGGGSSGQASPSPGGSMSSSAPIIEIPDLSHPLDDKSLRFRFGYWSEYAAAVAQQPFIGYGTSSAADGFDRLYRGTGSVNFEPHSIYFKAALELGIGGLTLLLAIIGGLVILGLRLLRGSQPLALTLLGIVTLTAVSGLSGPMLDAYPFNLLFWSIAALVVNASAARAVADP